MSQTKKVLAAGNRTFILIGTAHVSKESCAEVENEIRAEMPECVAIELDEQRYAALNNPDAWKDLDIVKVLKAKKGFLLLANLALASFQKRIGTGVGVKPGDEMRAGIRAAEELGIRTALVDRSVQTTLRRAWANTGGMGRAKLISALLSSAFGGDDISTEQIESLKKTNEMDSMMAEISDFLPSVKEALIDERDFYLAAKMWDASKEGEKTLAVLGAGHLPGVERNLEKIARGEARADTSGIDSVPPKKAAAKAAAWLIPILIVALIAAGFVYGGKSKGASLVGSWVVWNSALAGIGTLLALGHPLTVLVAVVGAPITSLCPFIGVGFFTGLVQAAVKKPKVADLERLSDDASSVKGFYRNRVLRILLVFLLSSIGSSIGTFVAGSSIVASAIAQ